jgi:hypothetical protein
MRSSSLVSDPRFSVEFALDRECVIRRLRTNLVQIGRGNIFGL